VDLNKVCSYEGKEEDVIDAGAVVAGKMDVDDKVAEVVSPNKVADMMIAQLQSGEEEDVGPGTLILSSRSNANVIGHRPSSVTAPR